MKTKRFLISVLCLGLLLFALAGYAQTSDIQASVKQRIEKIAIKSAHRSQWYDANIIFVFMLDGMVKAPEIRVALNISDELHNQIHSTIYSESKGFRDSPEYKELEKELESPEFQKILMTHNVEDADEETQNKFLDIHRKMELLGYKLCADALNKVLPPELKQKIGEAHLVSMGETPIYSPSMFVALNLTDAQKQEIEKIKEECEPEFEQYCDIAADYAMILSAKIQEVAAKESGEYLKRIQNAQKIMEESPEYKKMFSELQIRYNLFITKFKPKMFDVLTDEQWKRLQELNDNPPEHAKVYIKIFKEQRVAVSRWDVLQSGETIPGAYRKERNARNQLP